MISSAVVRTVHSGETADHTLWDLRWIVTGNLREDCESRIRQFVLAVNFEYVLEFDIAMESTGVRIVSSLRAEHLPCISSHNIVVNVGKIVETFECGRHLEHIIPECFNFFRHNRGKLLMQECPHVALAVFEQ